MAATMVDMAHETDVLGQDFEDQLFQYDFVTPSLAFDDVNAADSELKQYICDTAREILLPLSSPPALSPSTDPSPQTSYIGDPFSEQPLVSPITPPDKNWVPFRAAALVPVQHGKDDFGFEDLIQPEAYQTVPAASFPETTVTGSARPPLTQPRHLSYPASNGTFTTKAQQPCVSPRTLQPDRSMPPPPAVPVRQKGTSVPCTLPLGTGLLAATNDSQLTDDQQVNHLGRSLSKRGRSDTSNTLGGGGGGGGLVKQNSKRLKQKENGYPCEQCAETFDRACDKKKHFQRTHAPKDSMPHSCPKCKDEGKVKRFLYPKDVRRHLKQVHKIITQDIASLISPNISPTSGKSTKTFGLWALCKTVVGLKKLRISVTSPSHNGAEPEKIIMVSSDQRAFVDVDVTGVKTAASLTKNVLSALDMYSEHATFQLQAQTYIRTHKGVQLGPNLNAEGMLDLVTESASSQGSERYFITTCPA